MTAAFGRRASSVCADQVLGALGGRTPDEALAAGESPSSVWNAICDAQDLPDDLRWHHRRERPKR